YVACGNAATGIGARTAGDGDVAGLASRSAVRRGRSVSGQSASAASVAADSCDRTRLDGASGCDRYSAAGSCCSTEGGCAAGSVATRRIDGACENVCTGNESSRRSNRTCCNGAVLVKRHGTRGGCLRLNDHCSAGAKGGGTCGATHS